MLIFVSGNIFFKFESVFSDFLLLIFPSKSNGVITNAARSIEEGRSSRTSYERAVAKVNIVAEPVLRPRPAINAT